MPLSSRACLVPRPVALNAALWRSVTTIPNWVINAGKDGPSQLEVDVAEKTVLTAIGNLPVSPLMDPSFHQARTRYTKPKEVRRGRVGKDEPGWRRELERNPYAQALATPVRICAVTKVALPCFFLQDFRLRRHPATGQPWLVPLSLAPRESTSATESPQTDVVEPPSTEHLSAPTRTPAECEVQESEVLPPRSDERNQEARAGANGPTSHVLARQDLVRSFTQQSSPYFEGNRIIFRFNHSPLFKATAAKAIWRKDMDTFIVELMRRRIVERFLYYTSMVETQNRNYIIPCSSYDDAKALKHDGCLLWVGSETGPSNDSNAPPCLSTMSVELGSVPSNLLAVHNLSMLLGEDHVHRLRAGSALFRKGSLFLLGKRRTLDLQLKLWKLQGYMAYCSDTAHLAGAQTAQ